MLYCPIPWINQSIRNNGDLRVCCQANQGPDKGLLRDENGKVYNASTADLVSCRNAQKMKDIRLCMLNDQWHPDCIRCEREEHSGINSRFHYEEIAWRNQFSADDAKRLTQSDGSINPTEVPVLHYDVRFGNKCNLRCRPCGPTDSDSWYNDHVYVWGDVYKDTNGPMKLINVNGSYKPEFDIYHWYEQDSFWEQMDKQIPTIRHFHTVGGEPFLIDQQFEFLDRCVKSGHAKHIRIEYNTNLTFIPKNAMELWKHFEKVRFGISVDGIGLVNDYIRYPSKWSNLEKNIYTIDNATGNIEAWLAVTVQIYNILHLPDMFKWKLKQNFKRINNFLKHKPVVTPHPLHSPDFLNVKVLPLDVKQEIKRRLLLSTTNFVDHREHITMLLKQYIDYMMAEDYSHRFNKFWEYNDKLDEIRNQKLENYIPDLYNLIKEYK